MAGQIVDVYEDDLEATFAMLRNIVVDYPYIAMDTEFPGVVGKPVGKFRSQSEYHFQVSVENLSPSSVPSDSSMGFSHLATPRIYLGAFVRLIAVALLPLDAPIFVHRVNICE
jgi:hypothetical protein